MTAPQESSLDDGAWGAYWRRTPEVAAHRGGSPLDGALARFWAGVLGPGREGGGTGRLLDFACGNGAVTQLATQATGAPATGSGITAFDSARTAVQAYRARFPAAIAVVADARRTPFRDGAFAVVASQFGIEYAGLPAVEEAARLVGTGGTLAAVMHLRDGAIHRECVANLKAVERVRDSGILPSAKEFFRRGAAVARGQGSQAAFRRADERLALAVREVDGLLRDTGDLVAGGAVARLYADLAYMYPRHAAYDPKDVAVWADGMAQEMEAYAGRMSLMIGAAVDSGWLDEAALSATARGLSVRASGPLVAGSEGAEAAAWFLVCERC